MFQCICMHHELKYTITEVIETGKMRPKNSSAVLIIRLSVIRVARYGDVFTTLLCMIMPLVLECLCSFA